MFLTGFISFIVLLLFTLLITFFFFVHSFYAILCNIDEVLSISLSAYVFVFGDFNVHHKGWLIYSGRTDRFGELCYNFSVSYDITQMVNFPTPIPGCDFRSPALVDLFLFSNASIYSIVAFLPLGHSDHIVVSVSMDFPSDSKGDAPFYCTAYDFSC